MTLIMKSIVKKYNEDIDNGTILDDRKCENEIDMKRT